MLDKIFYGNTLKDWGISIIIIIIAILFVKLLQFLNKRFFLKFASKTKNKYDDILFESLEAPVMWGVMLIALAAAFLRLDFPVKVHEMITKAFKILFSLDITWFFARLLTGILEKSSNDLENKRHLDRKFMPLVKRMLLIIIWIVGGTMALSNGGISVSSLLATLGIGGVAIALASQDTIKNILGGITIFSDKIFSIGDTVNINGVEGTVEDIGLRSTRIRTYEKRLVAIPNYKVTDASIVNISKEPRRRVVLKLGLTYDTTPEKMNEALQILRNIPGKIKEVDSKDLVANFTEFADSALVVTFIYFIKKQADIGATNSKVNFEILDSYNKAGLNFAFPSQTLYVDKGALPIADFTDNPQEESSGSPKGE